MLEEITMDKKNFNRVGSSPNKGSGIESKKTQAQDVSNKQFPKSSRRREPSGSNAVRSDQGKKPTSQKSKTMDKRPRPRGQYYRGGKESAEVEECEAEFNYSTGNKKVNINHLLKFNFEPRKETVRAGPKQSYQYGVRYLMSTQKHKYNKEQFLQANYQFVVRADADYSPYLADPDLLVNWDLIEQIKVASVEVAICPICMSQPVAGKMTRCGHIYCCHCILHYLSLSETSWRKCPLCVEAIHKKDLKSVKVDRKRSYNVGQQITFQLMSRERGSLMACPISQFEIRTNQRPVLNVSEKELDTAFAKLLTANLDEVSTIIEQEIKELEKEKADNVDSYALCFIEEALEICAERKRNLGKKVDESANVKEKDIPLNETHDQAIALSSSEIYDQAIGLSSSSENHDQAIGLSSSSENYDQAIGLSSSSENNDQAIRLSSSSENHDQAIGLSSSSENDIYDCVFDNTISDTEEASGIENNYRRRYGRMISDGEKLQPSTITAEDLEVPQPSSQTKQFYFYQASDGQQIYLHAVNVQMLEMSFGRLRDCPPQVTGIIVEKEAGSMTVELRNRLRYLQHLPVTAQFEVAEIELLPPMVSEDTIDAFNDQLEQRKKRRKRRAWEEQKREKRIAKIQQQQMGRHSPLLLSIDSYNHFPKYGISEDELPPLPPTYVSSESNETNSPSLHSPASTGPIFLTADQESSPSFAEILLKDKGGVKASSFGWPRVDSKPQESTPRRHAETVDSNGEVAPAPEYRQSVSDVIALAIQKKTSTQQDESSSQGGKKKKKKKTLLFATGIACASK